MSNPHFIADSIPHSGLLQSVFEAAVDAIVVIDERGMIQATNHATSMLLQYSLEEMAQQNINLLMPQPYKQEHDSYLHNYQTSGHKKIIGIGREVKAQRKDGTILPVRLSVSEIVVDGKRYFTGFIQDISNLKEAEYKLQELNSTLENQVSDRTEDLTNVVNKLLATNQRLEVEINERHRVEENLRQREQELLLSYEKEKELGMMKSRFVSMASHEFRTPLSSIRSSAGLIQRYTNTEQQSQREKHIQKIKNYVDELTGILEDFLSLSKLEEGRVEMNPTLFSWNDFLSDLIQDLNPLAKTGQKILFQPLDTNVTIELDKRIMKNVLFNIFSNAIKYSDEHTTIYCTTERSEPGFISVSVRDEGMGIPDEEQTHLFTRFFRASNAAYIQGTGLGLNIVKRYLNLMGGDIFFTSKIGKGTTFTVSFPIHNTKEQP